MRRKTVLMRVFSVDRWYIYLAALLFLNDDFAVLSISGVKSDIELIWGYNLRISDIAYLMLLWMVT